MKIKIATLILFTMLFILISCNSVPDTNLIENNIEFRDIKLKLTETEERNYINISLSYAMPNQELTFNDKDIIFEATFLENKYYTLEYKEYVEYIRDDTGFDYFDIKEHRVIATFLVTDVFYGDTSLIGKEIKISLPNEKGINEIGVIIETGNSYIMLGQNIEHFPASYERHWTPGKEGEACEVCAALDFDFAVGLVSNTFYVQNEDGAVYMRPEIICYEEVLSIQKGNESANYEFFSNKREAVDFTNEWVVRNNIKYSELEIVTDKTKSGQVPYIRLERDIFLDFINNIINYYNFK